MRFLKRKISGSALIFSIVFAAIAGITIVLIAKTIDFNAHQSNYFERLSDAYKLAETGTNDSIAQLIRNPNMGEFVSGEKSDPNNKGIYSTQVTARTFSVDDGAPDSLYYLVTSATSTDFLGRITGFSTRLHSYVKVSNVSEYFMAIKDRLELTAGINAAEGKIYAPELIFTIGGAQARFKCAEYSSLMSPATTTVVTDWFTNYGASVDISTDCTLEKYPRFISPLVFPQVLDGDLVYWRNKAGPHTVTNSFGVVNGIPTVDVTNVYPPGYSTVYNPAVDLYPVALHTTNNDDHIYYSASSINLYNINVIGQVLFVSEGNIYIHGNLTVADPGVTPFPGAGGPGRVSNAHQAVLIAKGAVIISSYTLFFPGGLPPAYTDPPVTQTIQALILTPNGVVSAQNYGILGTNYATPTPEADRFHNRLKLDFKGSIIAAGLGSLPNNLPNIFQASRVYAYDPTLKSAPPPYLPSISEIHYLFEERTNTKGLFN